MSLYTMSQPQYAYAAAPAPAPRHYSTNHGTSSAFSSSANPDEDWTKISDLAERRRIQNRIAQRNYRKKLKRRLEDLERKAGDRTPGESSQSTPKPSKRVQPAKAQKNAQPLKPMPQNQYLPDLREGDHLLYPSAFDGRERSLTPPLFTYSTYPPPEELLIAPYSQSPSYPVLTTTEAYPAYLATTMPATLPSMTHFSDATKRDSYSDAGLSPYMSYGFIPSVSVDVHSPPHYDHSNPNTPPLSHSFDHSTNCSDSGYDYPTTPPLSIPGSPGIVQLDLSGRA